MCATLALSALPALAGPSLNPDVAQETIRRTICVPGYTASVRPATNYTNGVKRKLLRQQGLPESDARYYELDHIVPLALGGHPRALDNLQLEPWDEATRKDKVEVALSRCVCAGRMSLEAAQKAIVEDWQSQEGDACGEGHAGRWERLLRLLRGFLP